MSNVEHGGRNAEVERAVKLLEKRDQDNNLARTVVLEMKIMALPDGVRALAEKRLALRGQSAPATPMTARAGYPEGEAFANIDALHKAKEEKSRTKATVEGAVRHLPEAIDLVNDAIAQSGMIEAVSAATDVAMPGVGIAIEQAPKVAAAPFKINSAVEAEKKRKKIDKIASEAEDTLDDDDEVVNRSAVTARAAVRRQKGNPDRLRWQSGGNRLGESELTGQHQYWSDEGDADAPASKPATTSSVAAQNARDIAGQLKKKRNKKLVDAGTAFVPKSAQLLEFRRNFRGDGWTGIRNQQKRVDLATELLELAYSLDDEDSRQVMEELVDDETEREKIRMLYSSPITEGTAIDKVAKKLAGRRG